MVSVGEMKRVEQRSAHRRKKKGRETSNPPFSSYLHEFTDNALHIRYDLTCV